MNGKLDNWIMQTYHWKDMKQSQKDMINQNTVKFSEICLWFYETEVAEVTWRHTNPNMAVTWPFLPAHGKKSENVIYLPNNFEFPQKIQGDVILTTLS